MNVGSGVPGLIKVWKVPSTSPPRTLIAPISVIALPVFGEAPDVSKSKTTKVVSDKSSSSTDLFTGPA